MSISVSVAKLLVLPVWGTVSTSGLYLMLFSIVERCRRRWKWIGRSRKLCRSRWDHVEMFSRCPVIATSGFGGFLLPVCICRQEKSAQVTGLTAYENVDIPVGFFHLRHAIPELRLKPVFFTIWNLGCPSFPTKIGGTVRDMGKFFGIL